MSRRYYIDRPPRTSISAEEAEELFSKVDNSGHTNAKKAEKQRKRRKKYGHGVAVDPLSADDPSGSNVGKIIQRASIVLVGVIVATIVFIVVYSSAALRRNTANLSSNVSVRTVADALEGGIEWGNGFTQFPQDFSVQEADENSGRIEVSVIDTTSPNYLVSFTDGQIQATAFSVNSLLNPQIDTVIYHVYVHTDEEGELLNSAFFGFLRPVGELKPFMTFIWTKNTTPDGEVRFNCTVTGVDADLQETLRKQLLKENPSASVVFGGGGSSSSDSSSSEKESETAAHGH